MNNYMGEVSNRSQTLLIVEGNHEKNELFWLIFQCFSEISIDLDNVWIYGTNIYMLYEDIVKEYGADWAEEEIDIDLPFVISKKQTPNNLRYKDDFTNIILVFDYERHDTNFSEGKILEMQNSFSDVTDMGKLYINYPMIESYQHLMLVPDPEFAERKITVSLQPGSKYKELEGIYEIAPEQYKESFKSLDLCEILNEQNRSSSTEGGFIWVLNTCVFVVADYNFSLVQREN